LAVEKMDNSNFDLFPQTKKKSVRKFRSQGFREIKKWDER